jgi:hypothetical protein
MKNERTNPTCFLMSFIYVMLLGAATGFAVGLILAGAR